MGGVFVFVFVGFLLFLFILYGFFCCFFLFVVSVVLILFLCLFVVVCDSEGRGFRAIVSVYLRAVVHDGLVVVGHAVVVHAGPRALLEVPQRARGRVLVADHDVVVPVRPLVLVDQTNRVADLMQHDPLLQCNNVADWLTNST